MSGPDLQSMFCNHDDPINGKEAELKRLPIGYMTMTMNDNSDIGRENNICYLNIFLSFDG